MLIFFLGWELNFGLRTMCHQKDPTFFRSLSPKDPPFYQLSPNDPLFLTNSLSLKDPDTSLSLKDPSFSHLIVKQVTIFGKKIEFFEKFWQIWWNVEKFLAILALKAPIFWCIPLKDPLFLCILSLKDPFFWCNLSPKDPYIWGAWWHLYVTFTWVPPPPPPGYFSAPNFNHLTSITEEILML